MKQLKTKQDFLDNIGKKIQFNFGGNPMVWILESYTPWNNDIRIHSDTLPVDSHFDMDINFYIQGISSISDVCLLEEEKKPSRIKHTYTTTFTRDDGVQFTKDSIDWVSIDALKEQEKSHYEQARAIRAKLNSHSKLKF